MIDLGGLRILDISKEAAGHLHRERKIEYCNGMCLEILFTISPHHFIHSSLSNAVQCPDQLQEAR